MTVATRGPQPPDRLSAALSRVVAADEPAIVVEVAAAMGSTPREAGAAMLVTTAESLGTIGGGSLEYHAIDTARVMLARNEDARELDLPLGPTLGQCCGGRVRLSLRRAGPAEAARLDAAERRAAAVRPSVLVFGCGHTGLALARALAPLPLATTLVDDRLDPAPDLPDGVPLLRLADPATAVADAGPRTAYAVMTHSHALDYRLAEAALRRGDAAYVGMIGSATKRARLAAAFLRAGGTQEELDGLACPIGGHGVPDKRPAVIAALTAAEILVALVRYGAVARAPATTMSL